MANRYTLHINSLEDFCLYLRSIGWERVRPVGDYEVARLKKGGEFVLIYRRDRAKEHLTIQRNAERLFKDWMAVKAAVR